MRFSFRKLSFALISSVLTAVLLSSCGDVRFTDLSDEKKIEYIQNYMKETYDEDWTAYSVLQRTEKLGNKIPAGSFITSLTSDSTGDVVNMWITPDGEIFENRFMLRMREPAKEYLVKTVENAVPGVKAYAFVTIEYPELFGDYRHDGNVEPLLTEPNLNIEVEVYAGTNYTFRSEDIQPLISALSGVQFDSVDIWQCSENVDGTLKENSELKLNARKMWHITKDANGKFACTKVTE